MTNTYLSIGEANGYRICTMTEDLCRDHNLPYPTYFALTPEKAPSLSPSFSVHMSDTYDKMVDWCYAQPNHASSDSTCYISVTYRGGRNIVHDQLWFASRDEAKEYATTVLDTDDLVSRYTVINFKED